MLRTICGEILIDRPAAVVTSSTIAASGRGLYASYAYKKLEAPVRSYLSVWFAAIATVG